MSAKKTTAAVVAALLGLAAAVPLAIWAVTLSMVAVFAGAANAADGCATAVTPVADGPIRLPVTGGFTVTSEFGMRYHPVLHINRLHAGLDLAMTPRPGPVVAAAPGTVAQVVHGDPGAGNLVAIDHGGAVRTRYLHLASTTVATGQQVTAGQVIGVEGSTGASTGAHLHFETIVDGRPQDPREWLAKYAVTVPKTGGSGTAPQSGAAPAGPSRAPAPAPATALGPAAAPGRIGHWSGQQVRNAGHVISAGRARGLDDWTVTVAVMAAMGESGLTVLSHGDAVRSDTAGLFQEGPERGPYEKRMDPVGSANIFFDHLLAVPGYRDLAPTIAAHRTQSNADPFHYQRYWPDAVQVVSVLTSKPGLLETLGADGAATDCAPEDLEAAAPAGPTGSCPPSGSPGEAGLRPAALRTLRCVHQAFPKITTMYGVGERAGPSDHATGEAVDFMLKDYRTPQGRAYGWQVANWARAHATELGVTYVIYDMKIWNTRRDSEGWRPYTRYGPAPGDTLAHKDHVHISF